MPTAEDIKFLMLAYNQAEKSYHEGGIPVGAVMVRNGQLLAAGHNRRAQHDDSISHGETDCLRQAGIMPDYANVTMYTTLSPCMMCTGAIIHFGIQRVVIGEAKNFAGNPDFLRTRGIEVAVLDDDACIQLMTKFIQERPDLWYEDIAGNG